MFTRVSSSIVGLIVAVAFAVVIPTSMAAADPAVVFNTGQGNSACSITAFGGNYLGHASTTVLKDGTLVLVQCQATLRSGSGVSKTQIVDSGTSHLVVTPAGNAVLIEHK